MTRLVLADDHEILRTGLRTMLDAQSDFQVIGEAGDGREAVKLAQDSAPDVVIMDIGMPGLNGLEATRAISKMEHPPAVVILSMHSDRRFVTRAFDAGAKGYCLKAGDFEEVVAAVHAVASGKAYVSPEIASVVIAELNSHDRTADERNSVLDILSHREREVLQLISEGMSTKMIAATLCVSVKTVETHRHHVMVKLGIDSVAGLTKLAVREGVTSLDSM